MDIQPANQQSISDDQELAKVLAGVSQQADEVAKTPVDSAAASAPQVEPTLAATTSEPVVSSTPEPSLPTPTVTPITPSASAGDLEDIKKDALLELRPLVDKLEVTPEEKFDTYLLLLRSTDDQALIAPAHEAAKNITDETRRAQALLDIIKEIDYLTGAHQQAA